MNEDSDPLARERSEIAQAVLRYAEVLDNKQLDRLDTVFCANAELLYLLGDRLIRFSMRDARAIFDGFLRKCWWTCHNVSTPVIEVADDEAHATSRAHATHLQIREDGTRSTWIVTAAYDDELVRAPHGWRIQRRRCDARYEAAAFSRKGSASSSCRRYFPPEHDPQLPSKEATMTNVAEPNPLNPIHHRRHRLRPGPHARESMPYMVTLPEERIALFVGSRCSSTRGSPEKARRARRSACSDPVSATSRSSRL